MRLRSVQHMCIFAGVLFMLTYIFMHYYASKKEAFLNELRIVEKKLQNHGVNSLPFDWSTVFRKKYFRMDLTDSDVKPTQPHKVDFTSSDNSSKLVGKNPKFSAKTELEISQILDQLAFDNKPGGAWTQGFEIQYDINRFIKRPLEVFIVPHSHHDPGWVLTVDEYFQQRTKPCLDSTLSVLLEHPEARFIYAEMSFFSLWFDTLSEQQKLQVKNLLQSGQLEIVSGGWVMTDEATSHFYAMIDQMIEGHRWLLDNLDYRPNISWSIDPFGQSTTMAYLVKKIGFHAMIINRVHYEVKKYLALRKYLEFFWQQSWDSLGHTKIFTHMFPFYSYDIPHTCGPEPAICCQFDFYRLKQYGCPWHIKPVEINQNNVAQRAKLLADQYLKKATLYNNDGLVLIPLGDDFRYQMKSEWDIQLRNYGQLINYFNTHSELGVKARFATVSDYITELQKRFQVADGEIGSQMTFPSFSGDLFTYADRNQDYWSGYFTSRPYQKWLSRQLESELRSSEILFTFARQHVGRIQNLVELVPTLSKLYSLLTLSRRALGLFQHHDAIPGTAKPHVVQDYSSRLLKAIEAVREVSSLSSTYLLMFDSIADVNSRLPIRSDLVQLFAQLAGQYTTNVKQRTGFWSIEDDFQLHELSLPTAINLDVNDQLSVVYLFNPHTFELNYTFTVSIKGLSAQLECTHKIIAHDSVESKGLPSQLIESVNPPDSYAVFIGPIEMPALSLNRVELRQRKNPQNSNYVAVPVIIVDDKSISNHARIPILMENDYVRLSFDETTGILQTIQDKLSGQYWNVNIDFLRYSTPSEGSHSGAYLFIPDGPGQPVGPPKTVRFVKGELVDELIMEFDHGTQIIRIFKLNGLQARSIEIENIVNLGNNPRVDIDFAMRIRTNITDPDHFFYTDSNCFQFVRRQYYTKIPLQGNVYPMACGVYIEQGLQAKMKLTRLNLFTSFPIGVTSPEPGVLHLWLDRRSSQDDNRGVGAPLAGRWIVKSHLRLFFEELQAFPNYDKLNPGLSLIAHHILLTFARPVQRFQAGYRFSNYLMNQLVLLTPPSPSNLHAFPNFYELVNLRTFYLNQNSVKGYEAAPSTQVGLILRHLGSRCSPNTTINCTPDVDVAIVFGRLKVTHAVRTNLTMTPQNTKQLLQLKKIHVNPMELDAFFLV